MGFAIFVLIACVAVILAARGSMRNLATRHIRAPWLLATSLGIRIALELVDFPRARNDDFGVGTLLFAYLGIAIFIIINLKMRGMVIVLIGIAMNSLVVGLNKGMPTEVEREKTGELSYRIVTVDKATHQSERPDDKVQSLGDHIPLPPPLSGFVSFGDLVIAAGVINVAFRASRPAPPARGVGQPGAKSGAARDH